MKPYLCLYEYRGMETEGRTNFDEHFRCLACDKSEALYMYIVWLAIRQNREPYCKSLSEYKKSEYATGGWGFFVYELANLDNSHRSDTEWFLNKYAKYNQ